MATLRTLLTRGALVLVAGAALTACGGGGDAEGDAEEILVAYARDVRTLAEAWPGVGAGPSAARDVGTAQRPTVDDIGELATRAADLAADADGDRAAALDHLAKALAATHANLDTRLGVLGRDELWPLDFYCTDLPATAQQVQDLGVAFDEVGAAFELDRDDNVLARDGGVLTTIARCGDATSAASTPLVGPAGGLAAGSEDREARVRAGLDELNAALGGFDSTDPLVVEGRDALQARVAGDLEILDAASAFRPDPAKSDAENAQAFGKQNEALFKRQVAATQAWSRALRRLVAAQSREGS